MNAMKKNIQHGDHDVNSDRKAQVILMTSMNGRENRARPVRESLSWFSEKMEQELAVFDSSLSAWETEAALAILEDMEEQVTHLRSNFIIAMKSGQPKVQDSVIDQCVQVANLAHMIASSHHPVLSHYRNGKSVD